MKISGALLLLLFKSHSDFKTQIQSKIYWKYTFSMYRNIPGPPIRLFDPKWNVRLVEIRGISTILQKFYRNSTVENIYWFQTVEYHWKLIGIRPADPLVTPQPEFLRMTGFHQIRSGPVSDSWTRDDRLIYNRNNCL